MFVDEFAHLLFHYQPDEYERASARWERAASIPSRAASALTRSARPDVAARLARLMLDEPSGWKVPRSEIYRTLARVGGPAEIEALRQIDERTLRRRGWVHLCDLVDQEMLKPDFKEDGRGAAAPCGGASGVSKGDYRVVGHGDRMWLRRRTEAGWGPPAVAAAWDEEKELDQLSASGGQVVVGGYTIEPKGRRWRTVVDAEKVLADRDGDGISDATEAYLGTDPAKPDTDGDGVNDGEDESPLVAPTGSDEQLVQQEALRYLTRERTLPWEAASTIIRVWNDRGKPAAVSGMAGLVLHCRKNACVMDDDYEVGYRLGPRVTIRKVTVRGDTARVATDGDYEIFRMSLSLRRVGGTWRVVEAKSSPD